MASYNHERYVGQAIRSVLDQSFQDFELIITDDASTDGTPAEIARFTDPRIRFSRSPTNGGQFAATNHCLRQACGEYIAVLNSDDMFLPTKLERQVRFLDDHPEVGAVLCQARVIDDQGQDVPGKRIFVLENKSRVEWLNRFFYRESRFCHPSVLIRRQCHEVIGGYDERYAQLGDFDLWIRLCLHYEMFVLPDELVAFRWLPRDANMSGRRPDSIKRRSWEHRHILDNFLSIQDIGFFLQVFPEARGYGDDLPPEFLPFVLARLALRAKSRPQIHQAFALDTMFRLLGDPQTAEALSRRFDFHYKDLIKLTGQCDASHAFAIREMRARRQRNPRALYDRVARGLAGWRGK